MTRSTLAHATAGSAASILAMAALYPLDRMRSIAQADSQLTSLSAAVRHIMQSEGLAGFYSGLPPMLVSLGVSNFVFFYWNVALKAIAQMYRPPRNRHDELGTLPSLLIASLAGVINVLLTTPLWVATTRLALQSRGGAGAKRYRGLRHALARISNEEGLAGLWSGLVPSLFLVGNPAIQFVAFEKLKSLVLRHVHGVDVNADAMFALDDVAPDQTLSDEQVDYIANSNPQLTHWESLYVGGLSKLVATLLTYPLQVAQTRMRAEANVKTPKYHSTLHCLVEIFHTEGVSGLFAGMHAKIVQTVCNSALLFLVYERLSQAIFAALVRNRALKH